MMLYDTLVITLVVQAGCSAAIDRGLCREAEARRTKQQLSDNVVLSGGGLCFAGVGAS